MLGNIISKMLVHNHSSHRSGHQGREGTENWERRVSLGGPTAWALSAAAVLRLQAGTMWVCERSLTLPAPTASPGYRACGQGIRMLCWEEGLLRVLPVQLLPESELSSYVGRHSAGILRPLRQLTVHSAFSLWLSLCGRRTPSW